MPALAVLLLCVCPTDPRQDLRAAETPSAWVGLSRVERRLGSMGTWLELTVGADGREAALAASEAAVRALEACEARLTTWSDASELARVNASAVGNAVQLSPELAHDLARATELWRATDGAFDPGLGALVQVWGLRTGGRVPAPEELAAARAAGGFAGFALEGRALTRLHADARIEEGGFGKGIGLDQALRALDAAGARAAVLDLGGQLAVLGAPHETTLAHPHDRARAVLAFTCAPGSLATSGSSERGILVDGVRRAHILDPRSGEPAPDFGSMSVWAADATTADALSTALFVLGLEAAFLWREAHPELAVEFVALELRPDGSLRAHATEGLRPSLRTLSPELELSFRP